MNHLPRWIRPTSVHDTLVDSALVVLYREAKGELERVLNGEIAQINSFAAEFGIEYAVDR